MCRVGAWREGEGDGKMKDGGAEGRKGDLRVKGDMLGRRVS